MNSFLRAGLAASALMLAACETGHLPPGGGYVASSAELGGTGVPSSRRVAPPAGSGGSWDTAATPPPDAQLLYQNTASDAFGRSSQSGIIQQRGGVVEEVHVGNQPIYPGQPVYGAPVYQGTVQPGYVPTGTSAVYDPVTGRMIPVRRR